MINLFLASLIILAGGVMNMAVILANGGMPVNGIAKPEGMWVPMVDSTRLAFYGDMVGLNGDFKLLFSIGDLVMYFGGILAFIIILRLRYAKTH